MFQPKITGKYLKKKQEPTPDLGASIESVVKTVGSLNELKTEIETSVENKMGEVDAKLQEVDSKISNLDSTLSEVTQYIEDTKNEAIAVIKEIKQGETGQNGLDGKNADETAIIEKILSKIPKAIPFNEKKLKKEILSFLPDRKADLKIIQENIEIDPMSVIDKIMALPEDKRKKLKLKSDNIDGLEQTISAFRNQLSRGYLHGGGGGSGGGVSLGGTQTNFTNGMVQYIGQNGLQFGDMNFTRDSVTNDTNIQATYGGVDYGHTLNGTFLFGSPFSGIFQQNTGTRESFVSGAIDPGLLSLPGSVGKVELLSGLNNFLASFITDDGFGMDFADNSNTTFDVGLSVSQAGAGFQYIDTPTGNTANVGSDINGAKIRYSDTTTPLFTELNAGATLTGTISNTIFNIKAPSGVVQSSLTHGGSGLNDASATGTYSNYQSASFVVTCIGNNGGRIGYAYMSPFPIVGETVMQTTGTGAGSTAIVVAANNGRIWFSNLSPVGTGFAVGQTAVFQTSLISITITGYFTVGDVFHYDATYADGSTNGTQANGGAGPGGNAFEGGFGISFVTASSTGHTVGDTWSWTETVSYADMIKADAVNGLTQLYAPTSMVIATPAVVAGTATNGQVLTLTNATTGEVEFGNGGSGSPGGPDTSIQYNHVGAFDGDADMYRNATTHDYGVISNNVSPGYFTHFLMDGVAFPNQTSWGHVDSGGNNSGTQITQTGSVASGQNGIIAIAHNYDDATIKGDAILALLADGGTPSNNQADLYTRDAGVGNWKSGFFSSALYSESYYNYDNTFGSEKGNHLRVYPTEIRGSSDALAPGSDNEFFFLNFSAHTFGMGDFDSTLNGTTLLVDDANSQISGSTGGQNLFYASGSILDKLSFGYGALANRISGGNSDIAIGYGAGDVVTNEDYNLFFGSSSNIATAGINGSIAIGHGAITTSSHQLVFGSRVAPISEMTLGAGSGANNADSVNVRIRPQVQIGTNENGKSIDIWSGLGDGTGYSGDISLSIGLSTGISGTGLNTPVPFFAISGFRGDVNIGDNTGAQNHFYARLSDQQQTFFMKSGTDFVANISTTPSFKVSYGYKALNTATGDYSTAFGYNAGVNVSSGVGGVYLGANTGTNITTGEGNVFVGLSAGSNSNVSNCVVLGMNAQAIGSNQFVTGAIGHEITEMWIGRGVQTGSTPPALLISATRTSGTDIQGGDLSLSAGQSTGSAAGGWLYLKASRPGASGGTLNTVSEYARFGNGIVELCDVSGVGNLTRLSISDLFPAMNFSKNGVVGLQVDMYSSTYQLGTTASALYVRLYNGDITLNTNGGAGRVINTGGRVDSSIFYYHYGTTNAVANWVSDIQLGNSGTGATVVDLTSFVDVGSIIQISDYGGTCVSGLNTITVDAGTGNFIKSPLSPTGTQTYIFPKDGHSVRIKLILSVAGVQTFEVQASN